MPTCIYIIEYLHKELEETAISMNAKKKRINLMFSWFSSEQCFMSNFGRSYFEKCRAGNTLLFLVAA